MKKPKKLGTSDTWSMSRSSQRPSKPAYYIEDCRISYMYSNTLVHTSLYSKKENYEHLY